MPKKDAYWKMKHLLNVKKCQYKCPCEKNKCHLGVFEITPKETETSSKLNKVQKEFYLGHGIKTNDSNEAANIFLVHALYQKVCI